MLSALLGFSALSSAETVRLYFDPTTPQIAFAAGDIKAALEKRKHMVQTHDLAALAKAGVGKKIVLAVATDKTAASMLSDQGGKPAVGLGAQAYALRTTTAPDLSYWVLGGDASGAMYGGLQLAENIQFHDLARAYDEQEAPHLKNRGIKFNLPLDKESPTYFYGFQGTSHKRAVKDVWNLGFWKTWFDEMARHRYNVLSLWSPHPFTSMVNMEDEYPGIAIQGVTGFDAAGQSVKVNNMSIAEKIDYWRGVMKYGRERGFDIYICNWNVFLSTAEGKHGLTHGTDNPKTKEYLRKCVLKLFQTYPDLKGFGITVGERMGNLYHNQKEEWAWDSFSQGVMQYAKENPARDIVFIHRQHDGNMDHILKHFAQLDELPNVRLDLSCKYSEAHAHATVTPSRWHRTGMEQGLGKYGLRSWLTVRNDDYFKQHLAARFPEVPADKLFEAWSSASGAIRRANEQVTGKWQYAADFWPEMWTGDLWQGREGRHFSVKDTQEATPFAGSKLASLRDTAAGKVGNQISAWDNIEKVDALYLGVDMQRNRSFTNWHAHDQAALQDYLDLDGVGEPAWPEQP